MLPKLTQIEQIRRLNWTNTVGNSVEYTYFTGIEANNPSGSTDNIKTIVYKDGFNSIVLTISYDFDILDHVIKESAL